jgi:hypothetical protein
MAMRELEAGDGGGGDLVLRAMMSAPVGPALTDEERAMIEELGDEPHGVDHETMMSLIAALPE